MVGVRLPELEASKEEKRAADLRSRLLEVQKQAAKYFFYQLKAEQGGAARKYLENRGLTQKSLERRSAARFSSFEASSSGNLTPTRSASKFRASIKL